MGQLFTINAHTPPIAKKNQDSEIIYAIDPHDIGYLWVIGFKNRICVNHDPELGIYGITAETQKDRNTKGLRKVSAKFADKFLLSMELYTPLQARSLVQIMLQ